MNQEDVKRNRTIWRLECNSPEMREQDKPNFNTLKLGALLPEWARQAGKMRQETEVREKVSRACKINSHWVYPDLLLFHEALLKSSWEQRHLRTLPKNSGIKVRFPVDKYPKQAKPVNLKGDCLSYCREVSKLMDFEIPLPKCTTEETETTADSFVLSLTFFRLYSLCLLIHLLK